MRPNSSLPFAIASFQKEEIYFRWKEDMEKTHSPVQFESPPLPKWIETEPMEREEQGKLTRILSFERKIHREELPVLFQKSKNLESLAKKLDPSFSTQFGYLNLHNIVMASSSDDYQRIYLYEGCYAEVIYRYEKQRWIPFDSAPVYFKAKEVVYFFSTLREAFEYKEKSQ